MMKQLRLASLIFTTMTIVLGCSSSPDEQSATLPFGVINTMTGGNK